MNIKIQKLAEQAGFYGDPKFENLETFAELIVKECADVCERFGESGDGYTCSAEILEKFGVE